MVRKDLKGRNLRTGESQRSDGRYMYRYSDLKGKRRCIYSYDLAALRLEEKLIQKDIEDGIDFSNEEITVNQQLQKYLETKVHIANSTRNNYYSIWNNYIKNEEIGSMKLANVRKSDILYFYSRLSRKGIKNKSIQSVHNVISPSLQLAVDDDLIRKNPCKDCMKEYPQKDTKEKVALTILQQEQFLSFINNNKRYRSYLPMIIFMLGTGVRCGEMIGLTWDDIDFKRGIVSINHQLNYRNVDGKMKFYASEPKSFSGKRNIPLTNDVLKQLREQRENQFVCGGYSNYSIDGYQNFVFATSRGTPLQHTHVNHILYRLVDRFNEHEEQLSKNERRKTNRIPKISAHILRHTACTRMAEAGIDLKVLQTIMGHSNVAITMQIYNHVDIERSQIEIKKVEGKLEVL